MEAQAELADCILLKKIKSKDLQMDYEAELHTLSLNAALGLMLS